MKSGAIQIIDERARQINEEKWDDEHDDKHKHNQLVRAAVCYLMPEWMSALWPWAPVWWKPSPDNRVRELVKAGALIAAEIDRLQRIKESEPSIVEMKEKADRKAWGNQ